MNSLRLESCLNCTLLMRISQLNNDDDIFNYFIDIPQDFAVINGKGSNIIHCIAFYDDDVVGERRLSKLSRKTEIHNLINKKSISGCTPLYWAAKKNNHKTIQRLISLGSNVNIRNNHYKLPDDQFNCNGETRRLIRQARMW